MARQTLDLYRQLVYAPLRSSSIKDAATQRASRTNFARRVMSTSEFLAAAFNGLNAANGDLCILQESTSNRWQLGYATGTY
jgi:hypothetical protein